MVKLASASNTAMYCSQCKRIDGDSWMVREGSRSGWIPRPPGSVGPTCREGWGQVNSGVGPTPACMWARNGIPQLHATIFRNGFTLINLALAWWKQQHRGLAAFLGSQSFSSPAEAPANEKALKMNHSLQLDSGGNALYVLTQLRMHGYGKR